VYVIPGKNNKLDFDLYSLGQDGQSATGGNDPDDVNNWDPDSGRYYPDPMRSLLRRMGLLVLVTIVVWRLLLEMFHRRRRRRKATQTEESS